MTDLEKLKELPGAAADEPYERNTIHHHFMVEAATALPALIAELEAALEVVDAAHEWWKHEGHAAHTQRADELGDLLHEYYGQAGLQEKNDGD